MAATHQAQMALLTEHFRYTPLTLLDDIINTVNELVYRAINAIDQGLNSTPPTSLGFALPPALAANLTTETARQNALDELKTNEIDGGIVQLESLLNATVDKDFDKFEIYTLRNILAVGHDDEQLARWVRLEHYRNLDLSPSPEKTQTTPAEVQMQRRKLRGTRQLNTMLKEEEARNTAVLAQLTALTGASGADGKASPFAFLTSSPHTTSTTGSQPLTQNVQYALAQLPALRELLTQLKDSTHTLPNARHAREDPNSSDAVRRRYLDAQALKAIERRGVTSDEAGRVAAGAMGRRIGRDEVEGLEAVVQALGGGEKMEE